MLEVNNVLKSNHPLNFTRILGIYFNVFTIGKCRVTILGERYLD